MAHDPRSLALRWFDEIWNQGRLETADELLAPGAVVHDPGIAGHDANDPSDLKEQVQTLRGAFPDLHIHVDEIVCEGDYVAMRCTASGTHLGDGLGIPPTGREIRIQGMSMGRWENGRLCEGWNQFDLMSLFRQLGLLSLFDHTA